ncbi:MAG: RNA 3'-phosphate cyclase [Anaerolineales bacterium]|nr:RNA 3'-phosphate cyclase [Anaerolineales bacterium]
MMDSIQIDGSYGEGGGQVLRTCLALSALTGRPLELVNIRAGRPKPGLRPQHLAAVRAVAALCDAIVEGDFIPSQALFFKPSMPPVGGEYWIDVRDVTQGGSAGSVTLIAHTLYLPLSFSTDESRVTLCGGTHVPWSPPFHHLDGVFIPAVARMGIDMAAQIKTWGWYPVGGGEIEVQIRPIDGLEKLVWTERGRLERVTGVSAVTNLPSHIPQRMASRCSSILGSAKIPCQITPLRERGPGPGAGIFLTAEYDRGRVGFSSIGRKGKPSEKVAEEICNDLLAFHNANQELAIDPYLADQLILPMALANGESVFTTNRISQHALTNSYVIRQFLDNFIGIERQGDGGTITIEGIGYHV